MVDDVKNLIPLLVDAGAVRVGLFGSVARGEENSNSDIDLFVQFEKAKTPSLLGIVGLRDELEKLSGRKVDLITKLNRHLVPYVNKDVVVLYGEK